PPVFLDSLFLAAGLVAEFLIHALEIAVQRSHGLFHGNNIFFQAGGLLAFLVHAQDFVDAVDIKWIPRVFLAVSEPHDLSENICLLQRRSALFGKKRSLYCRDVLQRLHVSLKLVVETTFQSPALARKFTRVQREVLIARRAGGYVPEIRQPGRATQFATAHATATYPAGLLAQADLPHFDTYAEFGSKHFDKLPKINAVVGRIVKRCLGVVRLILDI